MVRKNVFLMGTHAFQENLPETLSALSAFKDKIISGDMVKLRTSTVGLFLFHLLSFTAASNIQV